MIGNRADNRGRTAAAIAFIASLYFLGASVVAHIANPQYSLFKNYMSDYAIGPKGGIFSSAFLASFIACWALTVALWQIVPLRALSRFGLALLLVAGTASVVDFYFPTDILPPGSPPVTLTGQVHLIAALLGWAAFIIGAPIISMRLHSNAVWIKCGPTLVALAWLSAPLFFILIAVVVSGIPFGGLAEKIFIFDRNLWMLLITWLVLSQATPRASQVIAGAS